MNALKELERAGGYVCAQYHGQEACLVGMVDPGSSIELIYGTWGSNPARKAILKTLRLKRVKVVRPSESVAILVGRPRQGTLMRWPNAGKAIERLVEGQAGEVELADLSPSQQEVLCSEFLRLSDAQFRGLPKLICLLLPVGGTMKDIDVYALAEDGRRIFAQVTFRPLKEAQPKLDRLLPYKDCRSHLLLFCKAEAIVVVNGVTVVPIEDAFKQFRLSPTGQRWFAQFATIPSSESPGQPNSDSTVP
jgi:hypothetical protein